MSAKCIAVEGCERLVYAKDRCTLHYHRERRGIPLDAPLRSHRPYKKRKLPGATRLEVVALAAAICGLTVEAFVERAALDVLARARAAVADPKTTETP